MSQYILKIFEKYQRLSQLFENGRIISKMALKVEYKLTNDMFFSVGSAKTRNSCKVENTNF